MSPCPTCGADVAAADQFCEACGATLHAAAPTPTGPARTELVAPRFDPIDPVVADDAVAPDDPLSGAHTAPIAGHCKCGGTFDADGWCDRCGLRAPSERDHLVVTINPQLAAVTDKGHHHACNEDAVALAQTGSRAVLVVCDGVSSTTDPEVAAEAAANAARDVLAAAPSPEMVSPAGKVEYYSDLMAAAARAANTEAVLAAGKVGGQNPPSCTFAAAVVEGELVLAAWIGDSRVYWLGDDGTALQMSIDDSWATEQIQHGMPRELAEADPRAHSITRWLGADAADPTPTFGSLAAPGAGWVLVCSDGLWNYCSGASDLAALVEKHGSADPTDLCSRLVDWANEQGGHDNITAALARVESNPTRSP